MRSFFLEEPKGRNAHGDIPTSNAQSAKFYFQRFARPPNANGIGFKGNLRNANSEMPGSVFEEILDGE